MRMVHNVYFTLHDRSDAAAAKLIASCKKYLTSQPGIEFFAAGARAKALTRPVNDLDLDVSLHLVFTTAEHQPPIRTTRPITFSLMRTKPAGQKCECSTRS